MPSVKLDHTNFHYRLDGPEDRPLVVLSHSLSVSSAMWRAQLCWRWITLRRATRLCRWAGRKI